MSETNNLLSAKFDVIAIGKTEIMGSIQPMISTDLKSTISIAPKNKMSGIVLHIKALDSVDLPSTIETKSTSTLVSSLFIRPDNTMFGKYQLMGNRKSDLQSTIQVMLNQNLPSSLRIRPNNKMEGIAEIIPPPTFTEKFDPVKDAYVRYNIPKLNYGSTEDMFVGSTYSGDKFRSLLEFDISKLPTDKHIKKAELVLNINSISGAFDVNISEILDEWKELGVTWANQPDIGELIQTFNTGNKKGELRIDLTAFVDEWFTSEPTETKGFELRAANETLGVNKGFTTKENPTVKPFLEVTYYDPYVYSFGRSNLSSVLSVIPTGNKDLVSTIDIIARIQDSSLPGTITTRNPNQLLGSIKVIQKNLPGCLYVGGVGKRDVLSSVIVALHDESTLTGSINPRVVGTNNLVSQVVVKQSGESDVVGSIVAHQQSSISSSIFVVGNRNSDLEGVLDVHYSTDLSASLLVHSVKDVLSEIAVRVDSQHQLPSRIDVHYANDLESSISIFRGSELKGSIFVKRKGSKDLPARLDVYQVSELPASLFVLSEYLRGTIVVRQSGETTLPGSIHTRAIGSNSLQGTIVPKVSKFTDLNSLISPRVEAFNDLEGALIPRILLPCDIESSIEIKKKNYAYAFII